MFPLAQPHRAALIAEARSGRRQFLRAATALSLSSLISRQAVGAVVQAPEFRDYPFALGVASGDPSPGGFVLWTRLAPDPLHGGGLGNDDIEVKWQVATDEAMKNVVRRGSEVASPALAHSVHVELDRLEPSRPYFYRFQAGLEVSPIGRTRTAPAADAMPTQLRFAFASCQHYEAGYYNSYYHMAGEDLDLVVHLGDYIYEGPAVRGAVRKHIGPEIQSLEDYRTRHALYRSDADLQATHRAFPWIVTWDDHEFDNNYANGISEQSHVDPGEFLVRRAAAYQAYYEHMPLRKTSVPDGPLMKIYRGVGWGRLADFSVLDTRQYRTDQPCGDGNKEPCGDSFDPNATMLGREQEDWLNKRLSQSDAQWNILAQQVMMARADRTPGEKVTHSMDQWPGYEVPRRRLMSYLEEQSIRNPIVLTGDIHTNWVNDLRVDFTDPRGKTVATEFVGTSISSGGDGAETRGDTAGVLAENPFVKFYNAERGYVSCTVTPERWRSDYQIVPYVSRKGAPLVTRASFIVEDGRPGAERA